MVGRILDERNTEFDSEQPARAWDDEQCFERIMWSVKEISSDFLTASYDEPDNRCQLSEKWFQEDARHYDKQQKELAPKKQRKLPRLEDLQDLHENYLTKTFETNQKRRILPLKREGRRVRPKMTPHCIQGMGLPSLKTCTLDYLLVSCLPSWYHS